jgi:hypothetical protein
MGINEDLGGAESLPAGSAAQMTAYGAIWHVYVWLAPDSGGPSGHRNLIVNSLNGRLAAANMRVNRGFQAYDPTVWHGRPRKYVDLAAALGGANDGGAGQAGALLRWMDGQCHLHQLGDPTQDLAIITHFAEQARGYGSALPNLRHRLEGIRDASPAAAKRGWADLATGWAPALTYQQDSRTDYVPTGNDDDDTVSGSEDELMSEDEDQINH